MLTKWQLEKENLTHFHDKSTQALFFVFVAEVSKRNRKHCYRNTHESLGELEKVVETLPSQLGFPEHYSFSQTSTRVSIFKAIEHFFYVTSSKHTGVWKIGVSL